MLIFGGSQGALKINQVTAEAIKHFNGCDYQVVFVTGQKRYDSIMNYIDNNKINVGNNVIIKDYISNMPEILPKVDAIIGRAGATSLAEITALGIPSILIPSPYVTADHQTKNALSLVKNGAALIITENDLNVKRLTENADQIMNNKNERMLMKENSYNMGCRNSADLVLDMARSILK